MAQLGWLMSTPEPLQRETFWVTGCVGCVFYRSETSVLGRQRASCSVSGAIFFPEDALVMMDPPQFCPLRNKRILVAIDELRVERFPKTVGETDFAKRMRERRKR